ncbi:MAG: bifunctional glutamate N-acetyltransferase/amino-acid acetyltransferase ArgJ [Deltaproteobacteria bacterium]|nr:bifunctional glutamate N-acetyltransferase/amino-acid acetyltransferase ArgJ [Deltaproteobacteria bacterium]
MVVPGFQFAGVSCGIKESGKRDLALIYSEAPAVAVGAFTTNRVKAAPVLIGEERLRAGQLQAIVVNSGNANASTGQAGLKVARDSCHLVAQALKIPDRLVIPSSTGKIGVLLPWDKVRRGIEDACRLLSLEGFWDALEGIMTTDAFPKASQRKLAIDGKEVVVAAMAKGAGMIAPNMATMLCYVMTDAYISRAALEQILRNGLADSFNVITVDGDTSTNDTVMLMANGRAGNREVRAGGLGFTPLNNAVVEVLKEVARLVVKDGEGATKIVDIFVRGAKDDMEAQQVARAVAYSPLVKTAFFGGDPNWGRIVCAVGYAGAEVKPEKVDILIDDVPIGKNGISTGAQSEAQAAQVMRQPEFSVTIDLHLGRGRAHVITSDLSLAYVRFNSAYST